MAEVIMPKMSDAMTEGKILSWRKQVGDRVARGEVIAEIETDKVNVEIEAETAGTLSDILVPAGQLAPVGGVIAHIHGVGDASGAPAAAAAKAAPAQPAAPPSAAAKPAPTQPAAPPSVPPAPAPGAGAARAPLDERVKISPIARRLAAERGIDVSRITGTGPGGRIVERDVEAAASQGRTPAPAPAAPAAPPGAGEPEYEDVELSRMRQAIARSVTHSMQSIPHFYASTDVEMGRAVDLRAQLKESYGDAAGTLSINDLILRAVALALRARPDLNATLVAPTMLRRFHRVHLGVMVALPDGLVVPVLRDADRLPLLALSREAHRLAEGARQRRLRPEEFSGATFSLSNLGMYDVTTFAAIINAPEAGILAAGRIQDRAVVRDGAVVARAIMTLTVSVDHRVTDGVGAATFLAETKRLLEHPVLLLGPEAVR